MTYFQAPADRKFDPVQGLGVWPDNPDAYRFFTGVPGEERIGIQTNQRIELQLTAGKDCQIESTEGVAMRLRPNPGTQIAFAQQAIWHTNPDATTDQHKFTVMATKAGKTTLTATDRAGTVKASLDVVAGKFEYQPGMQVDLIADVCRGSDSFKILALQQMLHNQFLGWADAAHTQIQFRSKQNVFSQQAAPNISSDPKVKTMTCRENG